MSRPVFDATEVLARATQNYCLTGEWGALARWKWSWRRVVPRWFAEMKRDELLNRIYTKESQHADGNGKSGVCEPGQDAAAGNEDSAGV